MPQEISKIALPEEIVEKFKDEKYLKFARSKRLLEKVLRLEDSIYAKQTKAAILMREIEYIETDEQNCRRVANKLEHKIARIERRVKWAENHKELIICICGLIGIALFFVVVLGASFISTNGAGVGGILNLLLITLLITVPGCVCGGIAGGFVVYS